MSSASVVKALSAVTGTTLSYISLVQCNVAEQAYAAMRTAAGASAGAIAPADGAKGAAADGPDGDAADAGDLCYLCLGKHALYLLDQSMRGVDGGFLITVPLSCVADVLQDKGDLERFQISLDATRVREPCPLTRMRVSDPLMPLFAPQPKPLPAAMLLRSAARTEVIAQLSVCWKTDYMYRTLSVRVIVHRARSAGA